MSGSNGVLLERDAGEATVSPGDLAVEHRHGHDIGVVKGRDNLVGEVPRLTAVNGTAVKFVGGVMKVAFWIVIDSKFW